MATKFPWLSRTLPFQNLITFTLKGKHCCQFLSQNAMKEFQYCEKKGDLFGCEPTDAIAHCISADCAMGKGIAVLFKKKFGGVQDLKDQGKTTGEVAVLHRDSRYVYYLITKDRYFHKPTYDTLTSSLTAMKKHCMDNNVQCVSMPKIGCGLDGLQWDKVSSLLKKLFGDTNISLTVYTI